MNHIAKQTPSLFRLSYLISKCLDDFVISKKAQDRVEGKIIVSFKHITPSLDVTMNYPFASPLPTIINYFKKHLLLPIAPW